MTAYGQLASTTGIVGNVADSAGATVQGATVTALNTGTAETLTTTTNSEGRFEFQFIKPGTYDVTVRQAGFETIVVKGLSVANNQVVRSDFSLKVGQVNETVAVTADIPPINTEDATVMETLSTKATAELPTNSRNALRLATTVPTVIPGRKNPAGNPGGGEGYIGAGTREIQNSISMDGVSIMNNLITTATLRPSVDAIQEFQVQTGTYSAQYGGYMGVQINVITKSGTNRVGGSVFHFFRNDALDARQYFQPAAQRKAPLRQNQFGFALTGPVVLPKLYDGRNKTFFLMNYEGLRNRQAIAQPDTVLTPAMRQGDFSGFTGVIRDPLTGQAFPGNIIPSNRLSPQAIRALAYMPLPNAPGRLSNGLPVQNYNATIPNANTGHQTINRVDHSIGQNTRLFFRYAWGNQDLLNGNTNPFNGYTQPVKDRNYVLGYTQVFTPALVNDFRFGRQFVSIDSLNFFNSADQAGAGTALGIPGFTTSPDNAGLPNLGITGFMPIGGQNMASSNWFQKDETYQIANTLNWNRGAHSISVGLDTRNLITQRTANNNPRGGFTFNGALSGFAGADFMLGFPQQVTTPGLLFPARVGQWRHGFFINDKWQVSSRLTLTLGLRYELPTVPRSLNGNATILNPQQTAFIPAQVPQTIPLTNPDRNNWAPRVGFAYRLPSKWVVRGGFGIYYNPNQLNSYTLATTNPPFSVINTYNWSLAAPLTLANPTPASALGAAPRPNAFTLNPDLPTASMNQWSFSVERGLWKNAGFDIQYLGSRSVHLDRSFFNNTPLPGPGNIDARRPNQNFRVIRTIQNDMVASYQGVSFVFRQTLAKGLTALASYTYSKTLDVSTDSNGGGAPMDPYNWRLDYGRSNWDLPHRFVGSFTYELPFLRGSANPFVKYALANWQINGILTLQSGFPFSVVVPGDVANNGQSVGAQRPNLLRRPTENCGAGNLIGCIDPTAFAVPTAFTFGNAGRNILRGPGFNNLDFSLFKNVPITERVKFQIRGEAFNLTNTPSFANPAATLGAQGFGNITATSNNNRQVQLGAKILF